MAVTGTFVDGATPAPSPTPTPVGAVLASFESPHNIGLIARGDGKLYALEVMGMGTAIGVSTYLHEVSAADGVVLGTRLLNAGPAGSLKMLWGPYQYDRARDVLWLTGPLLAPEEGADRVKTTDMVYDFAIDADGGVVTPGVVPIFESGNSSFASTREYILQRTGLDGATTVTGMAGTQAIAIDPAGNIWTGWAPTPAVSSVPQSSLRRYSADGTLLDTIPLPFVPNSIKSDGEGGMWVSDARPAGSRIIVPSLAIPASAQLLKIEADGTVGAPLSLPIDDFHVDATRHLWVASGASLTRLNPDGTVEQTWPYAANFVTEGDGVLYIGDGKKISKLAL